LVSQGQFYTQPIPSTSQSGGGSGKEVLEDKTKLMAKKLTARSEQTDDITVKLREFYDTHLTNLKKYWLRKSLWKSGLGIKCCIEG
jgi:hypothetical protein